MNMPTDETALGTTSRASDFRFIPVDALGFTFNDNGCKIILGVEELNLHIHEQVGAVMSHATTKLLWFILDQALDRYESQRGEIQIDPTKKEALLKLFDEADARRAESQQ
jgi:hypothetical protein